MTLKLFLTIFATILIAEVGDKTQLATMLFAADREVSKLLVFAASSAALVVAAGVGVLAGSLLSSWLDPRVLGIVAGSGFILIGAWTLYQSIN